MQENQRCFGAPPRTARAAAQTRSPSGLKAARALLTRTKNPGALRVAHCRALDGCRAGVFGLRNLPASRGGHSLRPAGAATTTTFRGFSPMASGTNGRLGPQYARACRRVRCGLGGLQAPCARKGPARTHARVVWTGPGPLTPAASGISLESTVVGIGVVEPDMVRRQDDPCCLRPRAWLRRQP